MIWEIVVVIMLLVLDRLCDRSERNIYRRIELNRLRRGSDAEPRDPYRTRVPMTYVATLEAPSHVLVRRRWPSDYGPGLDFDDWCRDCCRSFTASEPEPTDHIALRLHSRTGDAS